MNEIAVNGANSATQIIASRRGGDFAVSAKVLIHNVKWAYMHTKQIIYASAVFVYINGLQGTKQ